jgi:VWFA-related protein
MKIAAHSDNGIWLRTLACIGLLWLSLMMASNGQENRNTNQNEGKQAGKTEKDFTIKIGVQEVRLDAVVLDRRGHQITDLTADDFEIRQDGQSQKITSCIYINDYRPQPQPKIPDHAARDTKSEPRLPTPNPAREDVHRTIAFVVDNLAMRFDQVQLARRALQKFVETQMQPGDLVAIMPTASGNASLGMFSSDKRHLLAIIGALRWFIEVRTTNSASQFSVASYYIQALHDMPGRKHLIMITGQTMLPSPLASEFPTPILKMLGEFNPLADAALRAGVVIHTLDVAGLEGADYVDPDFDYLDTRKYIGENGKFDPSLHATAIAMLALIKNTETPIPLSKKTGGLFLRHFNWSTNGIGEANEELKGYYIVTYVPPSNTFGPDSRNMYHSIKMRVKRPGSVVHTRDGFFGIATTPDPTAKLDSPLLKVVLSPFRYNDLTVNLASGYIDDPQEGNLIRSWFHLDGQRLGIAKKEDGGRYISLEAHAVTTDINGTIQDSGNVQKQIPVNDDSILGIIEQGITVPIIIPTKTPGAYYVRVGVKDNVSGKMGSAFQYIEIPDLKTGWLSLSDIFVINRDEDSSWIQSGSVQKSQNQSYPAQGVADRSPALRSYLPGERIRYMAVIYNATTENGIEPRSGISGCSLQKRD